MSDYFISDNHFFHEKIIEYSNRPYGSVEEMNAALVERWQACVDDDEDIYVIGDMFMGQIQGIGEILPQLSGKIHLIIGNHDTKKRQEEMKKYGVDIITTQDACFLPREDEEFVVFMTHDPSYFRQFDYDSMQETCKMVDIDATGKDFIWLYGHVHDAASKGIQKESEGIYSYHVGVDTNDYAPVGWDQIISEYEAFKENEN